jgi:hypothetical protein
MRRKTVDCPSNNCDTVLASFNYLESIKEQETLIILLIKVSLVCLKIKFRTRCPIHRTHWKAIPCDNNYNNKSGPDWKLPSPCPSYGRPERPAMSTGKWLRPMGTNKWPSSADSTAFQSEKNVAYAKPEPRAPCSPSCPVTQRTADFTSAPDSNE